MNKELLKSAALVGVGVACGYGVGYLVTKKQLDKKFRKELQIEIDEVKAHYAEEAEKLKKTQKSGEYGTVADATEALANKRDVLTEEEVKAYNESLTENGYSEEPAEQTVINIWNTPISSIEKDETAEEPDAENEANWPGNPHEEDEDGDEAEDDFVVTRDPNKPYIIAIEEYMTDEDDFEKLSFGFYDEDGVLLDERDKPVPDVEGIVGLENLNHFGLKADSKNSLYIRNERIHTDIEINLVSGSYTEIFLGFPSEPVSRSKRVPRNDE